MVAREIIRAHNPDLLVKLGPLPAGPVLLRIFFGCQPGRVVLLVGAYDKGSMPARRRQQAEIDKARSRLAEYHSRQAPTPGRRTPRSFRRWWISQVRGKSEACGVHQSEISRIERGQISPTLDTLTKLAAPLGVRLTIVDADGRPVSA